MNTKGDLDFADLSARLLQHVLALVDSHIAEMNKWAIDDYRDDPGFFDDDIDHLLGIGFVACQRYIVSTLSFWQVDKSSGLPLQPTHRSGVSIAEAVNATANYWKHGDEWRDDSRRRDELSTKEILQRLGHNPCERIALIDVLRGLASEHMESLIPPLREWRNSVAAFVHPQREIGGVDGTSNRLDTKP